MKPVLIAIALVLLFSCKKERSSTNTYTVNLNNCSGEETGDNFQICFDSLWDSRCPVNVECVWSGEAKAKFRFRTNGQEHAVRLSTLNHSNDTIVAGYHLKLIDILPYPVYPTNPPGPIKATIEVTH